jgi:hypothetical protein
VRVRLSCIRNLYARCINFSFAPLPFCYTPHPKSTFNTTTGKRKRVRFTVRMESCERGRRGSGDVWRPVMEFLYLTATARPSAFSSSSFCSSLFVFCLCFVLWFCWFGFVIWDWWFGMVKNESGWRLMVVLI